eukprot:s2742_g13.t1
MHSRQNSDACWMQEKVRQVLAGADIDTDSFVADDWKRVLDGCCGGCPPELGVLFEDLQLASPRSTLDATSFLDAIFPGANFTDAMENRQMQSETVRCSD